MSADSIAETSKKNMAKLEATIVAMQKAQMDADLFSIANTDFNEAILFSMRSRMFMPGASPGMLVVSAVAQVV